MGQDHPFAVWIREYVPREGVESTGDLMEDAAIQTWERVRVGIVLVSSHSFKATPFRTELGLKLAMMEHRIVVDKAIIAGEGLVGLEHKVKGLMVFTWNRCLEEAGVLFRDAAKPEGVEGREFLGALEILKFEEECECRCDGGCKCE